MDCMQGMKEFPDKYFDLAIVDPPYGINKLSNNPTSRLVKYGQLKTVNENVPTAEYFKELRRVSKNQIVWGYNHLADLLPPTREFIFGINTNRCQLMQMVNWLIHHLRKQQNVLITRFTARLMLKNTAYIRHKNRLLFTTGS